jgi:hypothetical protein
MKVKNPNESALISMSVNKNFIGGGYSAWKRRAGLNDRLPLAALQKECMPALRRPGIGAAPAL